jgi:hypothetical protein
MKTTTSIIGRSLAIGMMTCMTLISCKNHSKDYGKVTDDVNHSGELNQDTHSEVGTGSSNSAPGISPDTSAAGSRDNNLNAGQSAGSMSDNKTPQDPAGTAGEAGSKPR